MVTTKMLRRDNIPAVLLHLRAQYKLTQQSVANAVGISRVSYNYIEVGRTKPRSVNLLRIRNFFEQFEKANA